MRLSSDADGDPPSEMAVLLMDLMEALAEKSVLPAPTSLTVAYATKKRVPEKHPEKHGTAQQGEKN